MVLKEDWTPAAYLFDTLTDVPFIDFLILFHSPHSTHSASWDHCLKDFLYPNSGLRVNAGGIRSKTYGKKQNAISVSSTPFSNSSFHDVSLL